MSLKAARDEIAKLLRKMEADLGKFDIDSDFERTSMREAIKALTNVLLTLNNPALNGLPNCPQCGAAMMERFSRKTNRAFLGCTKYPDCRGTRALGLVERFAAKQALDDVFVGPPPADEEQIVLVEREAQEEFQGAMGRVMNMNWEAKAAADRKRAEERRWIEEEAIRLAEERRRNSARLNQVARAARKEEAERIAREREAATKRAAKSAKQQTQRSKSKTPPNSFGRELDIDFDDF